MQLPFKMLGILLLLTGGILSVTPQWIHSIPQTIDSYEMIEKRVPYGLVIGLGIFLIFNSSWSSWKLTASFFMCAISIGIAIARIIGLFLDGIFSKQLLWLAIEILLAIIFGRLYIYFKRKNTKSDHKPFT